MMKPDSEGDLHTADRRQNDRKKLIVDVRFEGGDATGIANTRDIGSGGFYMTTTAELETGMHLIATLTLNGREMRLSGVVAYTDPGHGVGVRFKDIDEDDLRYLESELGLGS
ncbi:MAG: PilZ domain protein [Acidobacteria bacterium OLB17]|nr:MAG: PilZ domain protein [Acidobacteria bacterium OLB17]MCZ2390109.1 PilZ domain-containing protein [Acidobacteriota bacterium]